MARPLAGAKEGGGLGFFSFGFVEQPQASVVQAGQGADGERKATRNDTYNNCGRSGHWAKDYRQAKRGGQAHVAQAQEGDEAALFYMQESIELHSPPVPTAAALLHHEEPWAPVFLGNGSSGDKIDG